MILSDANIPSAPSGNSPIPNILNSVVKLSNPARGFTGSGVLLGCTGTQQTIIVSAMHLLWIYAGLKNRPADAPSNYINAFMQNVNILYNNVQATFGSTPGASAPITNITGALGQPLTDVDAWEYDVIVIKSTDANLLTFAQQNAVLKQWSITKISPDARIVQTPQIYLKKSTYTYLQAGYGATSVPEDKLFSGANNSGNSGRLQYRGAVTSIVQGGPANNSLAQIFYDGHDTGGFDTYQYGIQLTANINSSTAPGDSGGPLFAFYFDKDSSAFKVYLIGVTTGADMDFAPPNGSTSTPAQPFVRNNVSTSLTPMYSAMFTN